MNSSIVFSKIFDKIDTPYFIISVEHPSRELFFTDMNEACWKTTGLQREEVVGKRFSEIRALQIDDALFMEENCRKCLESNDIIHYEGAIGRFGSGVWQLTQLTPVRDDDGKIINILGSSVTISQQRHAEELIKKIEENCRARFEESFDGLFVTSPAGKILDINKKGIEMFGYDLKDEMLKLDLEKDVYMYPQERKRILSVINSTGTAEYEVVVKKKNGEKMITHCSMTVIKDSQGNITSYRGIIRDITVNKKIESIKLARLRLLEYANSHTMDELLKATLDELEILTDSTIGFYHFLENDQKTLSLQNWSTNTLKTMCTAEGKGTHYPIDQAGVWVDCVHERRPVIHNDYASLPHRKGIPVGHAEVVREVVIPVFRGNLIKAIIGVGNKITPYDESDVEIISQLGDLSWDIIERKLTEETLRRSDEEKTILNRIANIFLTISDEGMYREVLTVVMQVMKSKFGIFGYIDETGDLILPSLSQEVWKECQVYGKSNIFPANSWGDSLWGKAIREKKTYYSNGPFNVPEGHIQINHFLTAPIVFGKETIGLISVADKEGGYTEKEKDLLERITRNISPILHARLQRDIQESKRKTVEAELRESEEKYRLLVKNADEAIFIIQDEGIKFPNPKALDMTGYSIEELEKISFSKLIHPGDRDWVIDGHLNPEKSEKPAQISPFRIKDKTGKDIWVILTTASIIWEKKPGILCFFRDVTEEKKLEAQFMQAQKMEAVGRLAGGVAHDFNNMLGVIIGHTELALMKLAPSDPFYNQLQKIERAARRSVELTRQLLAFARKQTIEPRVLNLNDTISGMLNMLQRLIGEDIDLSWKPGEDLWKVKMDPSQIDRVLANLCVNARDAIDGVGRVTIETSNISFDKKYCSTHPGYLPGDFILFAVSDDGNGMDKETLTHLFEPFFTTKSMGKGTGLGLATVYGIINQNQGFINVYSETGKGTSFKIYLPRYIENESKSLEIEMQEEPISLGQETLLLVEDEPGILDLSKNMLKELGYFVMSADAPSEAIRIAQAYTGVIDLLITDVVMPEMNGPDMLKKIHEFHPDLKCLFMSGYTANVITHRGVLDEGLQFLQKPFSIKELGSKVRQVLSSKKGGS